jgi:hypothetical protein
LGHNLPLLELAPWTPRPSARLTALQYSLANRGGLQSLDQGICEFQFSKAQVHADDIRIYARPNLSILNSKKIFAGRKNGGSESIGIKTE